MNFTRYEIETEIIFCKDGDLRIVDPSCGNLTYATENDSSNYIINSTLPLFDKDDIKKYKLDIGYDFYVRINIQTGPSVIRVIFTTPTIGYDDMNTLREKYKHSPKDSDMIYNTKLYNVRDYTLSYNLTITFKKVNVYSMIFRSFYCEIPIAVGETIIQQIYDHNYQISGITGRGK